MDGLLSYYSQPSNSCYITKCETALFDLSLVEPLNQTIITPNNTKVTTTIVDTTPGYTSVSHFSGDPEPESSRFAVRISGYKRFDEAPTLVLTDNRGAW